MSIEDNKALARRYWEELWNTGNLASIEEIFAPDHTIQNYIERMKHNISGWRSAFPDFHATIEDILAEEDKVVVHWTIHGTNRGDIELESGETLSPTGKPVSFAGMDLYHFKLYETDARLSVREVSFAGMDLYHFKGGKIAELRRSWDIVPAALGGAGGVGGKIVELRRSGDGRGLTMTALLQDLGVVPPAG